MVASTFTPSPTYSGLALAAFFNGSLASADAVQADISYILTGPGQPARVQQTPTASKSVLLNPFTCILAGPSPASSGPQVWTTGTAQLTVQLADPDSVNPRVDLITVQITQNPDGSTTPPTQGMANLVVMTGTAAASPVEPTPPVGSLVVARINVPAGVSAVIANSAIVPRQVLGGLRGATVRTHPYASAYVARPGQMLYQESNDRVLIAKADSSLKTVPGFGSDWPEWFLRGVPAGFVISALTALGFSTADKAVGVSVSTQTTGAVITANESGSYFARASTRITANGLNTGERTVFLEHQTAAGARIRRIPGVVSNINGAPQYGFAAGRFRMNAGEKIVAYYYQSTGSNTSVNDAFGEHVFEGYKIMDL